MWPQTQKQAPAPAQTQAPAEAQVDTGTGIHTDINAKPNAAAHMHTKPSHTASVGTVKTNTYVVLLMPKLAAPAHE